MIDQQDTRLWFGLNSGLRYFLLHTSTRHIPLYVVNEYPKSGGSWVGGMLGAALGVPFPRNRLPMLRSSILHGHIMQSWNVHNMLVVWRDGRDVLVSQYFDSLFLNDGSNRRLVEFTRDKLRFLDYADIVTNLPRFMEYVYEAKLRPRMSWTEFVDRWAFDENCVHVKYEDMRRSPHESLARIVAEISGKKLERWRIESIVEEFSFESMTGRKAGEEDVNAFARKGLIGDWKNYFSRESRERFSFYAGDGLSKLGYERQGDYWTEPSEKTKP